jgi:hypothetical protein
VLEEMEEEHARIDPLLAAVDAGFATATGPDASSAEVAHRAPES